MELNGWRCRKDMGEAGRVESVIGIYSIVQKRKSYFLKERMKGKQNQHRKVVSSPSNLESPGDQDPSLGMWLRMLPED